MAPYLQKSGSALCCGLNCSLKIKLLTEKIDLTGFMKIEKNRQPPNFNLNLFPLSLIFMYWYFSIQVLRIFADQRDLSGMSQVLIIWFDKNLTHS